MEVEKQTVPVTSTDGERGRAGRNRCGPQELRELATKASKLPYSLIQENSVTVPIADHFAVRRSSREGMADGKAV